MLLFFTDFCIQNEIYIILGYKGMNKKILRDQPLYKGEEEK